MIAGTHPIVRALDESEWVAHLIGSRYVGVYTEESDYDFLVEATGKRWPALRDWLGSKGFVPDPETYGKDKRLHGRYVWTHERDGLVPVDILPVRPCEAKMRLAFFSAMKHAGHSDGGLLAKAMKEYESWPLLWACVDKACDGSLLLTKGC